MPEAPLNAVIEAILMASEQPVSLKQLHVCLGDDYAITQEQLLRSLRQMQAEMNANRGLALQEVASGFRYQTKVALKPWLEKWFAERPHQLSRVTMETLAIVAYHQPVTRGDIEGMRGVSMQNNIVRQLLERNWIKVIGHKNVPGKPELLGTTKAFLDYFNLQSLADLPSVLPPENSSECLTESVVDILEQ